MFFLRRYFSYRYHFRNLAFKVIFRKKRKKIINSILLGVGGGIFDPLSYFFVINFFRKRLLFQINVTFSQNLLQITPEKLKLLC